MRIAGKVGGGNIPEFLNRFKEGFVKDFTVGREDVQQASYDALDAAGRNREQPMFSSMMMNHPLSYRTREALGVADPNFVQAREAAGMGLSKDRATRIGQVAGSVGNDIINDGTRGIYWLLNAPQAVGQVIADQVLRRANERGGFNVFGTSPVTMKTTDGDRKATIKDRDFLLKNKMARETAEGNIRMMPGYSKGETGDIFKRNTNRAQQVALAAPAGLLINTGIGLMNPFGGNEGYKAILPSEEDPSKTDNVLGEVAMKYLLGQSGRLLPYDEFSQARPDVTKDEYRNYKVNTNDRREDYNPIDGDFAIGGGLIRGIADGIHGPELQFMGRSLPALTTILPAATSIAGMGIGASTPRSYRNALKGSVAGAVGGSVVGNLLEAERRRRNAEENGIQL